MQAEVVESALATVRPGLQADGFELRLEEVSSEGDAVICLEARPEACMECLVPDEVLVQIITNAIRRRSDEVGQISLVKRGFEDLPAH